MEEKSLIELKHHFDQSNFDPAFAYAREVGEIEEIASPNSEAGREEIASPNSEAGRGEIASPNSEAGRGEIETELSPFVKWLKTKKSTSSAMRETPLENGKTSSQKAKSAFKDLKEKPKKEEKQLKSKAKAKTKIKKVAKAVKKTKKQSPPIILLTNDVISETLADLLMQQGHTEAAIDMYEKLRLKYPEKSTYFADQIEKLKD